MYYKKAARQKLAAAISAAKLKDIMQNAAVLSAAGVGLAGGVKALDTVLDKGPDPLKRRMGYAKMIGEAPELEKKYGKGNVKRYYNTLYRFSERTATDPVAAAAWMKRSLQYKDVGPQTSDIKGLSDIEKSVRTSKRKAVTDALAPSSLASLSSLG